MYWRIQFARGSSECLPGDCLTLAQLELVEPLNHSGLAVENGVPLLSDGLICENHAFVLCPCTQLHHAQVVRLRFSLVLKLRVYEERVSVVHVHCNLVQLRLLVLEILDGSNLKRFLLLLGDSELGLGGVFFYNITVSKIVKMTHC